MLVYQLADLFDVLVIVIQYYDIAGLEELCGLILKDSIILSTTDKY